MAELVPILGGLLAGFVIARRVAGNRMRVVLIGAASVAIGVFAGLVSGELARSLAFLAIDVPAALIAVVVGVVSADRLGHQAAGERPRT